MSGIAGELTPLIDRIPVVFSSIAHDFEVNFSGVCIIERTDIPKEYGLITYTQDKIITIT